MVHPSYRILLINKSQQTTDAHVWDERWVQEVNLKSYIIYDYFTWHFGKDKNTGMVQITSCQGLGVGESREEIGLQRQYKRLFEGDGAIPYPDSGGGYMNV